MFEDVLVPMLAVTVMLVVVRDIIHQDRYHADTQCYGLCDIMDLVMSSKTTSARDDTPDAASAIHVLGVQGDIIGDIILGAKGMGAPIGLGMQGDISTSNNPTER